MALSVSQVWEVRTTGTDVNGGAFKAGSGGTDYSQQNAAQVAYTDLVIDGVTNTKVTSAGNPFTSAHVGNVINVTGGTGFTTGRYEVVSVATAVATLDRAVGTVSSTGGTGNLGGALATLGTLAASMVASNRAYVAGGTYSVSGGVTFAQTGVNPGPSTTPSHIIGYNSTRGDITLSSANQANRPLIQPTANALNVLTFSNQGWRVENLQVIPGGGGTNCNIGMNFGGGNSYATNCKVSGSTTGGISMTNGDSCVEGNEVTAATGGNAISSGFQCTVRRNWIHDCSGSSNGINAGNSIQAIEHNIISNMSGASAVGIQFAAGAKILRNTIYNCGSDGLKFTATTFRDIEIKGNIVTNCGGWGLNSTNAGIAASPLWDGNAYFSNTSGTISTNFNDTSTNAINAVNPYVNQYDVILSADPFTNKAANDFTLNNTAGGGAACRGVGIQPNKIPGITQTEYSDMGALQHQDAGGSNVYAINVSNVQIMAPFRAVGT